MRLLAWFCAVMLAVGGALGPAAIAIKGQEFVSEPRLILFGAVPVCVALVALFAMVKGDQARKLLVAYSVALGLALLAAEAAVTLSLGGTAAPAAPAPQPPSAEGVRRYPVACGLHFDLPHPRIRLDGTPVQPVGGVANNLLNPEDQRPDWRFSDQYGFNNPPGQWADAPVPVMVVGDSFTFGADVPIGKGYVDAMRPRLAQVVNLGCSANGPLLELASLAEYGPLARPRVVVWAYYEGNDLTHDLAEELASPILPRYLRPGFTQDLARRQDELDRLMAGELDAMRKNAKPVHTSDPAAPPQPNFGIRNLTLVNLRGALGFTHRLDPRMVETFGQVLARAKAIVSGWNGRLVLLYITDKARYVSLFGHRDGVAYGRQIIRIAETNGIPVIDTDPLLAGRDIGHLFEKHYTVEGYALVGQAVTDALLRLDPTLGRRTTP